LDKHVKCCLMLRSRQPITQAHWESYISNEWLPLVAIFYYYFFLFLNRIFSAEISLIPKYVNCPTTDFYKKKRSFEPNIFG